MGEVVSFPRDTCTDQPETESAQQVIHIHLVQPEPPLGSKIAFILSCAVLGLLVSLAVF